MDARDRLDNTIERLELAVQAHGHGDYLGALRGIGNAFMHMQEATVELIPAAYREGATKKAIAEALQVPASTLRGIRLER